MDQPPVIGSPVSTPPPIGPGRPDRKKRGKLRLFLIAGGVLLVLIVAGAIVIAKRQPGITVQTDKVLRRNLTEKVTANGKIQPVVQIVISPEVAGEIVALPVKEGDRIRKGDLLVQIKPDNYQASSNSAVANYRSAIASKNLAQAELEKADAEFKRNQDLFKNNFVSASVFLEFKTAFDVAKLRLENAVHQEDQARFGLDKASDDLSKTTITAPIDGTVTRLKSQLGERVLGTSFNMGTEIMTVADLNEMEARVDIGEMDVVMIAPGQIAQMEVDAFKDRKFHGIVTEIANSANGSGSSAMAGSSSSGQDATKFQVRILLTEKELFRPGMSVTAEIETRYRTNVLAVPFASVTARLPKENKADASKAGVTNSVAVAATETNTADVKSKDGPKRIEVVFVVEGNRVRMAPVKIGISDDTYWEITDGLQEGQEIVSGGRALRDLEDGKKIVKGSAAEAGKKAP